LLSGTNSTDPQGKTLSFVWRIDGATESTKPQWAASLRVGTHNVLLIVTNTAGSIASASVHITISQALPSPTAVFTMSAIGQIATEDQALSVKTTTGTAEVSLSGVRSVDPSGHGLTYLWTIGADLLNGLDVTTLLPLGTVNITLTVTDYKGITATAAGTISITSTESGGPAIINVAPTVSSLSDFTVTVTGAGFSPAVVVATVVGSSCMPSCTVSNSMFLAKATTAVTFGVHGWQSGVYRISVSNGSGGAASNVISMTVVTPVLSITTTSLPSATVGTGYGQGITATGGQTPYTWSVASGLPPGLSLNTSVGSIFGTPTTAGTYRFTVTVKDSSSPQKTASQGLSITVSGSTPALSITTTSLPAATRGTGYGQGLSATGGQTPYTWSVSSGLPPGLSLNPSVGSIFGTPTTAGTYSFTVTVRDSSSPQKTASQGLSIVVH
jgi:hypothetical protein